MNRAGFFRQHVLVLLLPAAICLAENFMPVPSLRKIWADYHISALIWSLAAVLAVVFKAELRFPLKARHRKTFCWAALMCGAAWLTVFLIAGLLKGFGRSPYDHSAAGISVNFLCLALMLSGMEVYRFKISKLFFGRKPFLAVFLTGLMFTFFSFPLSRLGFASLPEGFQFAGGIFLPAFAENILASYLVYLAGPLPSLIFRAVLLAFQRFSPVLPDLNWLLHGFISIFVLASSLSLLEQLYRSEVARDRSREKESYLGWIAASIVSVVLIWFAVGVFDIFPTVVVTGSMSPYIKAGDIVIVQKTSPAEITVDDVIQFREENMKVIHRVVSLHEENSSFLFVTKGDANEREDAAPVAGDQIMGKVVKVIPKIGRITMRLRGAI